jgi:hexosaminidase
MRIAGLLACMLLCCPAAATGAAPKLSLIPWPAQITAGHGTFHVDANTVIVAAGNDPSTLRSANYLANLLKRTRGLSLAVKQMHGGAPTDAIVLRHDAQAPVTAHEGYALTVNHDGIDIDARDDAGVFYGAITTWQLLTPDAQQGAVDVPQLSIRDQPRFGWRGLMIDSARHMQSVDDIKQLLDQMAQAKLNVFHWHLTDDQGWRIEIKRYPDLTRIGAWRTPPAAGTDGEPQRYGGFYTQDQIRDVVAYAADRHITILPELDMPGHAQAAVASYPQFGVTGKRPAVSPDWGINPYLYNVDDQTFVFIENVLDEVMTLFPSKYIHLGGDEAIKDQWQASPSVQAKMHALGLKNEEALQGWFMGRLGDYLASHGRRLIGWDEILDGHVPADATVMSWRGTDGAIKAARLDHDVVMSPAPDVYFDGVQSNLPQEISGRVPAVDLADIYAFNPMPKALTPSQAAHVLGAQGNIWTEHLVTMQHVERATFPRLAALSEAVWTPADARDWQRFIAVMPAQLTRYGQQQINYSDSAFAPTASLDVNAALTSGAATVALNNQAKFGHIYYTLDGRAPDAHAQAYSKPFEVTLPVTLRAAAYADDGTLLGTMPARVLDHANLLSRLGVELSKCAGDEDLMRLQPMPDATSLSPVYLVNSFNGCQLYPATPLSGIASIHVDAVRLERNYALAHDQHLVVVHPHSTPFGEFVVHRDTCSGPVLATMPLPDPAHSARRFSLESNIPAQQGTHGLCLVFAAPVDKSFYALDRLQLVQAQHASMNVTRVNP